MVKVVFILLVLFTWSCGTQNQHGESSEENHDVQQETMLGLTLFTDSVEFFIEYPALVKGEEAVLTVHVTRLSSYKPVISGEVQLKLDGAAGSAVGPEEPGIFVISLRPEKTGMRATCITWKDAGQISQVCDSLMVYETEEYADKAALKKTDPYLVNFGKEETWNSDFKVEQIIPGPFSPVIHASGEMLPVPGEKQHVVARSAGIVLFASRNLVQGSKVARGQLLFTISGQDLADNNISVQFSETSSRFLKSRDEYGRHRRLHTEKIISDKQLMESRSGFQVDSAAYFAISASFSPKGLGIHSPLGGYLHELNVAEGQYVATGQELATISSNEVLLIRADVPQQHYNQLSLIETAQFRPAYSSRIYSIIELNGRLLAKGASVAENNHYIPVYFEVKNDGTLLEGAFADIYLVARATDRSLVVPVTSILEEQGNYYVYVQQTGASYMKRPVKTGTSNGLLVSVESGLSPGDRVVTRGAMLLKAASMSASMPAHNHDH